MKIEAVACHDKQHYPIRQGWYDECLLSLRMMWYVQINECAECDEHVVSGLRDTSRLAEGVSEDAMITGHHMRNQNNIVWFVTLGSATGGKLRYSDASMINQKREFRAGLKGDRSPRVVLSLMLGDGNQNTILQLDKEPKGCNNRRWRCVPS